MEALSPRFRSTAAVYARFRLAYPEELIVRVAERAGLKPGAAVMDLGAGPGLLALPFARLGMQVTAVDPEPEMLAALKEAAERADLAVSAVLGSSFSLPDGLFNLVVMGRAFHWTDRSATAKALDAQITAGGAIALFDDETIKTAENRWRGVMDRVAARFGADKAPHRAERADPAFRSHESILLDSPFSMLETVGVVVRRPLSLGDILGYAASLSVTSRHALGEKHTAFESELTEELLALSPKGRFSEIAEMRALIARRP